jgi:hypothetical protein
MTPEELDSILSTDETVEPSPRFASSVMAAVRRDTEYERPRFPWLRFATGIAASLVMAATGTALLADSAIAGELAYATAAMVITAGLVAAPRFLRP